ncbi:MAG: methyltransferase domain-containing protein [Gemmatimonadetes bacterium]|nr:methyltransferase domain-containing protein [Gemmatimonadota bacterium]NIO32914.1 methyltransferase domain-containing protein [Gemmatimonadota bacterium]
MQRVVTRELLDQRSPDPALLRESLDDLAWMNRYLGVTVGVTRQLGRLLEGRSLEQLRVLDVGAGGADILAALGRRWTRRGRRFEGTALDSGRVTARIAAAQFTEDSGGTRLRAVCGDARALPFPDACFDVTICSTFLHHLDEGDAVRALGEMARVSVVGIVVTDLRRGRLGLLAARTLANTVWRRHRYTRHDAPASMRAAYTLAEVRELAMRAGMSVMVRPQLWFRWALCWRRPA